jgi:hypothetical protein
MGSAALSAIISAVIAITVAVLTAGMTYVLTRKREHEADWRKIKLDLYRTYVVALSGVLRHNRTSENQAKYADAVNSLTLVASPAILKALYSFQDGVSDSKNAGTDRDLQKLVDGLLIALREDIGPAAQGQARDLSFRFMEPPPGEHEVPVDQLVKQ